MQKKPVAFEQCAGASITCDHAFSDFTGERENEEIVELQRGMIADLGVKNV